MQKIVARIKLYDRELSIRKPVAYLGRSGCEYSGQLEMRLEALQKQNRDVQRNSELFQFLPIGDSSNIDIIQAKISYDYSREKFSIERLGNSKLFVQNLELDPYIPKANYVILQHNSSILINGLPCVFYYAEGIKNLSNLLFKNQEKELEGEEEEKKKKKKSKIQSEDSTTALMKNSQLNNSNITPIDINNLLLQKQQQGKEQKKRNQFKNTSNYLNSFNQFISKDKANSKILKRVEKNLKKRKNIKDASRNSFHYLVQKDSSTSLFNILHFINQIEIKYEAGPKQVRAVDPIIIPTTKRRGRPKKATIDDYGSKSIATIQKKQPMHSSDLKKFKKT